MFAVTLTVLSGFPYLSVYFGESSVTVSDCSGGQNNENEIQLVINHNFPLNHQPYLQKKKNKKKKMTSPFSAGGNSSAGGAN